MGGSGMMGDVMGECMRMMVTSSEGDGLDPLIWKIHQGDVGLRVMGKGDG